MIRTERLLLRRWRDEDRAPFAAMNRDPAVMEFYQGLTPVDVSNDFVDRIEQHWDEHGWAQWALEIPGEASFIGYTGLWPADRALGRPAVEVGWRLARAYWGHGYATEAGREALRFGFEDVGLDEIVSFTSIPNVRSQAVMRRIGLEYVEGGDFDHPSVDPAAYPAIVRHVLYRLDRMTWAARQAVDA